jgi:hypothetical protein
VLSRQIVCGLWCFWAALLAPGVFARAQQRGVEQSASQIKIEIPVAWRVDFKKVEPGSSNSVPVEFYVYERGVRQPQPEKRSNTADVLELPPIRIRDQLHPELLKLLRVDGMKCKFEASKDSGILGRRPMQQLGAADVIDVRIKVPGEKNDEDKPGWIEIKVPERISIENDGTVAVSIHEWNGLRARVGAGVFTGSLTFVLSNEDLHGGEPIRIIQPLTIVIAGSRLMSAAMEWKDIKPESGEQALRAGMRPISHVEIESLETDASENTAGLDPGWWVEFSEKVADRPDILLARLPLPIRDNKTSEGAVFRLAASGDDWCWDTVVEPPDGYRRVEDWNNEVILQRVNDQPKPFNEVEHVRLGHHTIKTYLPVLFRPGTLQAEVFWGPTPTGDDLVRARNGGMAESTTRRRLKPIPILSGFRASTDMPVTGEDFWIWAVVDLASISDQNPTPPDELYADLLKEDSANKKWDHVDYIVLKKQLGDSVEPNLLRYRAIYRFGDGKTGNYKIKLYTGAELQISESQTIKPPTEGLKAALGTAELPLRVFLEGETAENAPKFRWETPLKVFLDHQPFWWMWVDEPGFTKPYDNNRDPVDNSLTTKHALSFRWQAQPNDKLMGLRYRGIYHDQTKDKPQNAEDDQGQAPTLEPTVLGVKYDQNQPTNPKIGMTEWGSDSGESGDASNKFVEETAFLELKNQGAQGPWRYFEFHVGLPPGSDEQKAKARSDGQKNGPEPLAARFLITGIESDGRPIGRVYTRRFAVTVENFWDELWQVVSWHWVALVALVLAFVIGILRRRATKRKRKAARAAQAAQNEMASASHGEENLLSGLHPAPPDYELDQPAQPAAPSPTPPAPPSPRAAPEPSYLDNLHSDEDTGGSSYLD